MRGSVENFRGVSFAVTVFILLFIIPVAETASLSFTAESEPYRIIEERKPGSGSVSHRLIMDGYRDHLVPGAPVLPFKSFMIGLPPGIRVQTIHVSGREKTQLPGTYRILPVPCPEAAADSSAFAVFR